MTISNHFNTCFEEELSISNVNVSEVKIFMFIEIRRLRIIRFYPRIFDKLSYAYLIIVYPILNITQKEILKYLNPFARNGQN
jgi:hypothetical protein